MPKTPRTASPANWAIVPPNRSRIAFVCSKKRTITRCNDSGSSLSPSGVDPTMSVKRTVTVLRSSVEDSLERDRSCPHSGQYVAPSGTDAEHEPQTCVSDPPQAMQKRADLGFASPQKGQPAMAQL
jgi:hypothetical protein